MDGIEIGERWRHRKRGIVYEIIATSANLQCSAAPEFEAMFDDDHFIVYKSVRTGAFWIRPAPEFLDGRFEKVEQEES